MAQRLQWGSQVEIIIIIIIIVIIIIELPISAAKDIKNIYLQAEIEYLTNGYDQNSFQKQGSL